MLSCHQQTWTCSQYIIPFVWQLSSPLICTMTPVAVAFIIFTSKTKKHNGLWMWLAGWQLCAIIFRFRVSVQSFRIIKDCTAFVTFYDQSLPMLDSQVVSHSTKALVALVTHDADKGIFACWSLVEQFDAACRDWLGCFSNGLACHWVQAGHIARCVNCDQQHLKRANGSPHEQREHHPHGPLQSVYIWPQRWSIFQYDGMINVFFQATIAFNGLWNSEGNGQRWFGG